jgi:sugar phosphate isomerase/epimerase
MIKPALNAYSFDRALRAGTTDLFTLIRFCGSHGFMGLDATAYYMPGYPDVPEDRYLHDLKACALQHEVSICGTGVRNDFATPDAEARKRDVQLVKSWIRAAATLGAPVIRIFDGKRHPEGVEQDEVVAWIADAIRECAEFARDHGVMIGLQNHNEFAKTADDTIRIVRAVDSEGLGVILDTGSLRQSDPYEEIMKLLPYAISWQIKETVWVVGLPEPIDLDKLRTLVEPHGYQGFMPIEILGTEDPTRPLLNMLAALRQAFRI